MKFELNMDETECSYHAPSGWLLDCPMRSECRSRCLKYNKDLPRKIGVFEVGRLTDCIAEEKKEAQND